jgi:hypothetical protein
MIENLGKRCLRVSGSANQVGAQGWINLLWGNVIYRDLDGENVEKVGGLSYTLFLYLGVEAGLRCSLVLVVGLISLNQRAW